jgi:uncharacterized protein
MIGLAAFARSRPRHPDVHIVEEGGRRHLFVADGSRLYDAGPGLLMDLEAALEAEAPDAVGRLLADAGIAFAPRIDDAPLSDPPIHAISLAIAQKCNLACSYCYADQGSFGAAPKDMPQDVAIRAIDMLLDGAEAGSRVTIAFLGGEPLSNRAGLRAATVHAAQRAAAKGIDARFSITTNGTLLTPDDGVFFEEHGFAVTLSIDGPRALHDAQRPMKGGRGSYDRIMARAAPLLARQKRMTVGARVTVTPDNLALPHTLDDLIDMGFLSVGFSPMLRSPTGRGEMDAGALAAMLGQMIACGEAYEASVVAGRPYPFANMANAMREIGRGTHRPYPCGAGAGYLGVSADGELAACHRFVGDDAGAMGNLVDGVDHAARNGWLAARHVHAQEPCRSCWARYLCGGGCHHEVIGRGRPACDYIRGWLDYCLGAYLRLSALGRA